MKNIISIIAVFAFSSCATSGPDAAINERNANTNKILIGASQILGKFAVDSLLGTTKNEIARNGNSDMANSAAAGVWTQATNWVTSKGIEWAINSWSNRSLPKTADAAKDAFVGSSAPPAIKADAIAAVISTAVGAPPTKLASR